MRLRAKTWQSLGNHLVGALTRRLGALRGGDPLSMVATAIAQAEGYFTPGTKPNRYNNPGDLTRGDEWGQNVSGYSTFLDGGQAIIFATAQDGFAALIAKLQNIGNGGSRRYRPDMTWSQIGLIWANDSNWGRNVARGLGVSPDSTFADYFSGAGGPDQMQSASPPADLNTITQDGLVLDPGGNVIGSVNSDQMQDLPRSQNVVPALVAAAATWLVVDYFVLRRR